VTGVKTVIASEPYYTRASTGVVMITPALAYTRRFYKEREIETLISSCNYCYSAVAESSDETDLAIAEDQHMCIEKVKPPAKARVVSRQNAI
jgi:hypothetical protein